MCGVAEVDFMRVEVNPFRAKPTTEIPAQRRCRDLDQNQPDDGAPASMRCRNIGVWPRRYRRKPYTSSESHECDRQSARRKCAGPNGRPRNARGRRLILCRWRDVSFSNSRYGRHDDCLLVQLTCHGQVRCAAEIGMDCPLRLNATDFRFTGAWSAQNALDRRSVKSYSQRSIGRLETESHRSKS